MAFILIVCNDDSLQRYYASISLDEHFYWTSSFVCFCRRNKYDNGLEYWCETGLTGKRVTTETFTQRETVSTDGQVDEVPVLGEIAPSSWNVSSMLEDKELVNEEDAKNAQPKAARQILPKLEEEKPVLCQQYS